MTIFLDPWSWSRLTICILCRTFAQWISSKQLFGFVQDKHDHSIFLSLFLLLYIEQHFFSQSNAQTVYIYFVLKVIGEMGVSSLVFCKEIVYWLLFWHIMYTFVQIVWPDYNISYSVIYIYIFMFMYIFFLGLYPDIWFLIHILIKNTPQLPKYSLCTLSSTCPVYSFLCLIYFHLFCLT